MGHLPTAESHRDFHFVAGVKKSGDISQFHVVVVGVGVRSELHLFDFDGLLLLLGFRFALLLRVFEFSQVHQLANRRFGRRRDLNKIEPGSFRHRHAIFGGCDPVVFAFGSDQPDFRSHDVFIRTRPSLTHRRSVIWSTRYLSRSSPVKSFRCKDYTNGDACSTPICRRFPARCK